MNGFKVLRSELGPHHHLMMLNPVEFNLMMERTVIGQFII